MTNILLDLRQSLRMLLKSPGFVVVAVLALGFGIAINSSVFTLLNAIALRPLPVHDSGSVVTMYQSMQGLRERSVHGDQSLFSLPEYTAFHDQNNVFTGLAAYANAQLTLGGSEARQLSGDLVTCNYFDAIPQGFTLGRGFWPDECSAPGAGAVVVISQRLWQRRFGSDAQILEKPIVLNGRSFTIVGVGPAGFTGASLMSSDVWAPISMQEQWIPGRIFLNDPNLSWLQVIGRLKTGVSLAQARADLAVISRRIDQQNPPRVTTLHVDRAALMNIPQGQTIVMTAGAVVLVAVSLVLLIACANLANLLVARAATRYKEIGIRLALGATRRRLVIQMLAESLMVSITSGMLGLFAAWSTLRALIPIVMAQLPPEAPVMDLNLNPDLRVVSYLLGLSLCTGIGFGLLPALQATRIDLNSALKESASWWGTIRRSRIRSVLVAVQIAICLVLLIAAGLLARGLHAAQTIDPGFGMKNIVAATFDLDRQGYNASRSAAFRRALAERLAARSMEFAFVEPVPLSGNRFGTMIMLEGRDQPIQIFYAVVSPNYFRFLQIPIIGGQTFDERDRSSLSSAIVVSESTARRFWPGENPIGKRFRVGRERTLKEVIGVAKDVHSTDLAQADPTFVYLPQRVGDYSGALLARGSGNNAAISSSVLEEAHALDANVLVRTSSLEDNLNLWEVPARVTAALGAVLGIAGLLLASMGIYGVVSHTVSQRTKEIGIRMSLGANKRDVLRMMMRQIIRPVAVGGLAGLAVCAGVSRILQSLLFGISPLDPLVFGAVSLFLAVVALVAGYGPAHRATRIDPMVALRHE
jgi:predicted permease